MLVCYVLCQATVILDQDFNAGDVFRHRTWPCRMLVKTLCLQVSWRGKSSPTYPYLIASQWSPIVLSDTMRIYRSSTIVNTVTFIFITYIFKIIWGAAFTAPLFPPSTLPKYYASKLQLPREANVRQFLSKHQANLCNSKIDTFP